MKYTTKFSPDAETYGPKLIDYLNKDDVVIDITGVPLNEADRERWAEAAAQSDLVRQHAAMMSQVHSIGELAEAGREVAREHLNGQWVIGVHFENPGNPHIHIAQAGSTADCYMDEGDIARFRQALADRLGERIGGEAT